MEANDHIYKGGISRYKEIGHYVVPSGRTEVEFSFDYPLQDVLISCPAGDMPVCQGDLNWFAVIILDSGFILHSQVSTDNATVMWVTIERDAA